MVTIPPPSWEVFDKCFKCEAKAKEACINLKSSSTKNKIPASVPHRGRKRLKKPTSFSEFKRAVRYYLNSRNRFNRAVTNKIIIDNIAQLELFWREGKNASESVKILDNQRLG